MSDEGILYGILVAVGVFACVAIYGLEVKRQQLEDSLYCPPGMALVSPDGKFFCATPPIKREISP